MLINRSGRCCRCNCLALICNHHMKSKELFFLHGILCSALDDHGVVDSKETGRLSENFCSSKHSTRFCLLLSSFPFPTHLLTLSRLFVLNFSFFAFCQFFFVFNCQGMATNLMYFIFNKKSQNFH